MQRTSIEHITVILLLGVMSFLMTLSITLKSTTYDESSHLRYGRKVLNLDSDRVTGCEYGKMPFSVLNAVSFNCAKKILDSAGGRLKAIQEHLCYSVARSITILFSLLLGLFVFRWSRALYGFVPAVVSLLLYVFSPNIIAHSRLITTDLYAALMITVSTFYFWRFLEFGGWKRGVLSASVLGLSQLAKYTCVILYPLFLLLVLVRYSPLVFTLAVKKKRRELFRCGGVFSKYFLLFLAISILLINAGFLFNKSLTPLSEYAFKSDLFKTVQSVPLLRNIPVPVPYPYLEGLDRVKFQEKTQAEFGNIYLLGKLKTKGEDAQGFKGYFFYAFLFKEPIAIQVLLFLSVIAFILNRKRHFFLRNELFLLLPVLFFAVYFNYFFSAQIGIRYALVIFPFLYIFCGSLFKDWRAFGVKRKGFFILLLIYLVVSNLSYFPHYLSYFNESVGDRKQAYKLLADSNLDWGQNEWYLREYKKKNPGIKVHPEFPTSGKIVVSANRLVGVLNSKKYQWLRENFEPVDHVAYSYLVYEVSPEDLKRISARD